MDKCGSNYQDKSFKALRALKLFPRVSQQGQTASACVWWPGPYYMQSYCYEIFIVYREQKRSWQDNLILNSGSVRDLIWWKHALGSRNGDAVQSYVIDAQLTTDCIYIYIRVSSSLFGHGNSRIPEHSYEQKTFILQGTIIDFTRFKLCSHGAAGQVCSYRQQCNFISIH